MSLVSYAIRLAVTRLLSGQTWAEDRVLNAPIDPITEVLEGGSTTPLIAVFTNDEKSMDHGREWGGRPGEMDLILFIYLPPAIVEVETESGEIAFEARSAGGAAALDLIAIQCRKALRLGPPVWRKLFEAMVAKITEVRSRPILVELQDSIKIPVKEITISLMTLAEPDFGKPLAGQWVALDAAMRADRDAEPLADIIKSMFESPDNLADWQLERVNRAMSENAIRALGLAPADETEEGEAPPLVSVEQSGEFAIEPPEGLS